MGLRPSQEPALVRRPFPRPGPAAVRGSPLPGGGDPSVTTGSSSTGGYACIAHQYPPDHSTRSSLPLRALRNRNRRRQRASPSSTRADRAPGGAARRSPAPPLAVGFGDRLRSRRIAYRGADPRSRSKPHLAVRRRDQDQRPGGRWLRPIRAPQRRSRLADRDRARARIGVWGSEAIGGVIAVNGLDDAPGYSAVVRRAPSASSAGAARLRCDRTDRASPGLSDGSARRASTASPAPGTRTATATSRAGFAVPGTRAATSNSARRRSRSPGRASSTASILSPSPTPTRWTATAMSLAQAACGRASAATHLPGRDRSPALSSRRPTAIWWPTSRSIARRAQGAISRRRSSAGSRPARSRTV